MRGRSGAGRSESKFGLKTLKVSNDTINAIRAPIIWQKPEPKLFDYHYDVAGLYYQPMISYCLEREEGGERRQVEMPDRVLSNFDKRAYGRLPDREDYDSFLAMMYQRRMKANNAKTIHVENERWSNSRKTSDLNPIRGADVYRDKYLCQIQLIHTGRVAQNTGEERARAPESPPAALPSGRYGPGFTKLGKFTSRPLAAGGSGLELVGIPEPELLPVTVDVAAKQALLATTKYDGYLAQRQADRPFIEAETNKDFLAEEERAKAERAAANRKEYKPLYLDTSYIRALSDVQSKVKRSGRAEDALALRGDINVFYRKRKVEEIGKHEKAVINSEMFKEPRIPEFDLGYDTVERRCVPVTARAVGGK